MRAAAKCQIILARALSTRFRKYGDVFRHRPLRGRPDSYGLDHTVKRTRITRMHADLFRLIASEFLCFNPRDQRSSASRFKKYIVVFMESRTKGSRKNKLAFWRERRAGRCKAPRRRRCGDIVEERQRRRYAPWPPRPAGLRLPRPANHCGLPVMIQLGMGAAAKCQIILARALS